MSYCSVTQHGDVCHLRCDDANGYTGVPVDPICGDDNEWTMPSNCSGMSWDVLSNF